MLVKVVMDGPSIRGDSPPLMVLEKEELAKKRLNLYFFKVIV